MPREGGVRCTSVSPTTPMSELLQTAIDLFFPSHKFGNATEYIHELLDYDQCTLSAEDTVGEMYARTMMKPPLTIYLYSLHMKSTNKRFGEQEENFDPNTRKLEVTNQEMEEDKRETPVLRFKTKPKRQLSVFTDTDSDDDFMYETKAKSLKRAGAQVHVSSACTVGSAAKDAACKDKKHGRFSNYPNSPLQSKIQEMMIKNTEPSERKAVVVPVVEVPPKHDEEESTVTHGGDVVDRDYLTAGSAKDSDSVGVDAGLSLFGSPLQSKSQEMVIHQNAEPSERGALVIPTEEFRPKHDDEESTVKHGGDMLDRDQLTATHIFHNDGKYWPLKVTYVQFKDSSYSYEVFITNTYYDKSMCHGFSHEELPYTHEYNPCQHGFQIRQVEKHKKIFCEMIEGIQDGESKYRFPQDAAVSQNTMIVHHPNEIWGNLGKGVETGVVTRKDPTLLHFR